MGRIKREHGPDLERRWDGLREIKREDGMD